MNSEPVPSATGSWVEHWNDLAFLAEVDAWVGDAARRTGQPLHGDGSTVSARFWSVVRRYPTSTGSLWFKCNHPGQRFEAGLTAVLARILPAHVAPPVAVDPARGWLLTADQGPVLGQALADHARRRRVVTTLAQIQLGVAADPLEALATGLTAVEPHQEAGWLDELIDRLTHLSCGHPLRPGDELAARARLAAARLDTLAPAWDARIPTSLDPNDVHANNVFANGVRLFDFGDAVWAHPFSAWHGFVGSFDGWAGEAPTGTELDQLRRDYLMPWKRACAVPYPDLLDELDRAALLLPLHRLMSWHRLLDDADAIELAAWQRVPHHWLERACTIIAGADGGT